MSSRQVRSGITIFTGRFGSGKSETALNYALLLAQGSQKEFPRLGPDTTRLLKVILIDLDIVTPYFRSRETADAMKDEGVEVVAPSIVGQHLDTPAITPQILGAIQQLERPVVLDVGGDKQGARALGQFSPAIRQRGYTMHFVINPYRPFTNTLEGLRSSITEIEASARLGVTSLVSNPNLIGETTIERIIQGHAQVESFARALGVPVAFLCIEQRWMDAVDSNHFDQPILTLNRHFVMSWEQGEEKR
jgi:hypothetical protein